MTHKKIRELVSQLTLEEKAGLCSGADFWHTKAVERIGIPAMMMSDGPFGLRKQEKRGDHLGMNESIPAVCFPAGVNTASSFDRNLAYQLGVTLGEECQAEGIGVLLGPAMNIKRSPLCGRNFEYYSEDPYVSSEIASAYIKGLQSKNVGACPKHFYANNMEYMRMTSSSELDERTAREIYLASFEKAVKEAKPWSMMCSYNRINGTYAAENKEALTKILRDEWDFEGFVVSDWGATNDRVPDLIAGLDLEMPGSGGVNDKKIVETVQKGTLPEEILNQACERILSVVFQAVRQEQKQAFDREKDHKIARAFAADTFVLLKNEQVLPLAKEQKIAFIGKYAKEPRYQGGGSSHINPWKEDAAIDHVPEHSHIIYAQGFDDATDETDEALLGEALKVAKESDVAVLFVGLPDSYESEGFDRTHMSLPPNQLYLIKKVAEVAAKTVVVLHNGSPVEMPFADQVDGILECYLGGQAVGGAQIDVLYGKVNPSGRLAETFPEKMEDNPSHLNFCVQNGKVFYQEGVFVGYRYYEKKKQKPLFAFGHGLSYTEFKYSDLKLSDTQITDRDILEIRLNVTNTGNVAGKEVVQLYVRNAECEVARPAKELRGFEKISLNAQEEKAVVFTLDKRAFAYWDEDLHDWFVPDGNYTIEIGSASDDIRLTETLSVKGTTTRKIVYTRDTALGVLMTDPNKKDLAKKMMGSMVDTKPKNVNGEEADVKHAAMSVQALQAMAGSMPIRALISFAGMGEEQLQALLNQLNE